MKNAESYKNIEQSIIAKLWLYPEQVVEVSILISEKDFYSDDCRRAFQVIRDSYLKKQDHVSRLMDEGISVARFVEFDQRDIKTLAGELSRVGLTERLTRLLQRALEKINFRTIEKFVGEFSKDFANESGIAKKENSDIKIIIADYEKAQQEYAEKYAQGIELLGIESGFPKLDKIIDGIRKGHFWVIGGYTSTGKTYVSLNIVVNLIKNKQRVVYYSLEMSQQEILGRILGIMTGFNSMKILKGKFTPEEEERVLEAKAQVYESGLSIYSTLHDVEMIKLSMLEENMRAPVDCFFLDYMQLLTSTRTDKEYEVLRFASTDLQSSAKALRVPIIALSQVNNESVKNSNDKIIGFKGSGNIAASADLALEIIKTDPLEMATNKTQSGIPLDITFLIRKNRHGVLGKIEMFFNTHTGVFVEKL